MICRQYFSNSWNKQFDDIKYSSWTQMFVYIIFVCTNSKQLDKCNTSLEVTVNQLLSDDTGCIQNKFQNQVSNNNNCVKQLNKQHTHANINLHD